MSGIKIAIPMLLLAVGATLAVAAPPEAPASAPTPPAQPTVVIGKDANGVGGVVLTGYVQGDVQTIWSILENTQNIPKLFDNVKKVTLLEKKDTGSDDLNHETWEYQYDLSSPIGTKVVNIEIKDDQKTHVSTWHRVSGDLTAFEGRLAVSASTEYPGWAKVVYESYVDGGFFAPQVVTNALNKEDAEEMVPKLRALLQEKGVGGKEAATD